MAPKEVPVQRCRPHLDVVRHPADPRLELDARGLVSAVQDDAAAQYPAEESDRGIVEDGHVDSAHAGPCGEHIGHPKGDALGRLGSCADHDPDVDVAVRTAARPGAGAVQVGEDDGQCRQVCLCGCPQRIDQLLTRHAEIVRLPALALWAIRPRTADPPAS